MNRGPCRELQLVELTEYESFMQISKAVPAHWFEDSALPCHSFSIYKLTLPSPCG